MSNKIIDKDLTVFLGSRGDRDCLRIAGTDDDGMHIDAFANLEIGSFDGIRLIMMDENSRLYIPLGREGNETGRIYVNARLIPGSHRFKTIREEREYSASKREQIETAIKQHAPEDANACRLLSNFGPSEMLIEYFHINSVEIPYKTITTTKDLTTSQHKETSDKK